MATVCPTLGHASGFPGPMRNKPARRRPPPEYISVLSDSDDDRVVPPRERPGSPPLEPPHPHRQNAMHGAIVNYVNKGASPASNPLVQKVQHSIVRSGSSIPRPPRSKAVVLHRTALALNQPASAITKSSRGAHARRAQQLQATARASIDETRSVIEAAVREEHRNRYMTRKDVLQAITWHLRSRGYADAVIDLLMQTSYRLFNVNAVYYDTFEKQTVCVYRDGDWVPYRVARYHVFDGFEAFRVNEFQCIERVSINNHTKWNWPE